MGPTLRSHAGWRALCGMLALTVSCSEGSQSRNAAPSASAASAAPAAARLAALLEAEQRRDSAAVVAEDLSHRDEAIRRAAARALARIADARSRELLCRSLSDEDAEVVAWSAHGLGYVCTAHQGPTSRALLTRAATLQVRSRGTNGPGLDPMYAIADALARCGSAEGERTLRAWLDLPSIAEHAARALGNFASRQQRLEDATLVALLDAASRAEQPLEHGLYAFTRLTTLAESVRPRLIEVSRAALARGGGGRSFAIRALGNVGPSGVDLLRSVVLDAKASLSERADAARQLARLGEPGQRALYDTLEALAALGLLREPTVTEAAWPVVFAVVSGLQPLSGAPRVALDALSSLPIGDGASASRQRRVVALRCRGAALSAGRASLAPRLVACDPEPRGRQGALAALDVLDRGEITGARHARFQKFVDSDDHVIAQAALLLLPRHPEIPNAVAALSRALASTTPGTVAVAANVLSKAPDRASALAPRATPLRDAAVRPHPELVTALSSALTSYSAGDVVDVQAALIDAASALQLLSAKPVIEKFCSSPRPTLRDRAEKALRQLGDKKRTCDVAGSFNEVPVEAKRVSSSATKLVFVTDAGERSLTLDPTHAPIAVARLVDLAKSGFFANTPIHRLVPGFVTQGGDRDGDGFGGVDRGAIACETAPVPFQTGSVGLALSGRDTGSSQFFVTHATYPHLDGDYPLLGRAEPGWEAIAEGDVIREVRVLPP
jgi:cyclophilin family peptidyl-prolyl cis-trans isomerase